MLLIWYSCWHQRCTSCVLLTGIQPVLGYASERYETNRYEALILSNRKILADQVFLLLHVNSGIEMLKD